MTPSRLFLSAAFLLTLPLHAQTSENPEGTGVRPRKTAPVARAIVTGHVTCGDTRAPARGATIMLTGLPDKTAKPAKEGQPQQMGKSYFARAGLDGLYTVEKVAAGDYAIVAFLPGYLSPFDHMEVSEGMDGNDPQKMMLERLASGVIVHVGADGTQTGDLILERGATITGRVLYADGAPASMVNIEVQDVNAKPAKPSVPIFDFGALFSRVFTNQTMGTDDQGRFRVSGIRPGTYRVAVTQPIDTQNFNGQGSGGDAVGEVIGMSAFGGIADPNAIHFYSGDTLHKKSAKTYELRSGDTLADIDIRLPIDGFHTVRVHLSAADGRPINEANLTLVDTTDDSFRFTTQSFNTRDDPDGLFTFHNIPPGTYTLTAEHAMIMPPFPTPEPPPQSAEQPGEPEIEASASTFELHPTAAFKDSSTTVIVKDSDLLDLSVTLTETPIRKPGPPPKQ